MSSFLGFVESLYPSFVLSLHILTLFQLTRLLLCCLAAAASWWSSLDPKGQLRQRHQLQPKPTNQFQQASRLFSLFSHLDYFFLICIWQPHTPSVNHLKQGVLLRPVLRTICFQLIHQTKHTNASYCCRALTLSRGLQRILATPQVKSTPSPS